MSRMKNWPKSNGEVTESAWTRIPKTCFWHFVESMPSRILANKVATESTNLLSVVITLISEQLDLYGATVLFSIVS